jgi:hypothetical protein
MIYAKFLKKSVQILSAFLVLTLTNTIVKAQDGKPLVVFVSRGELRVSDNQPNTTFIPIMTNGDWNAKLDMPYRSGIYTGFVQSKGKAGFASLSQQVYETVSFNNFSNWYDFGWPTVSSAIQTFPYGRYPATDYIFDLTEHREVSSEDTLNGITYSPASFDGYSSNLGGRLNGWYSGFDQYGGDGTFTNHGRTPGTGGSGTIEYQGVTYYPIDFDCGSGFALGINSTRGPVTIVKTGSVKRDIRVRVNSGVPPIAKISIPNPKALTLVSDSYDPDNNQGVGSYPSNPGIVEWEWTMASSSGVKIQQSGPLFTISPTQPVGTYAVTLSVMDDEGETGKTSQNISIINVKNDRGDEDKEIRVAVSDDACAKIIDAKMIDNHNLQIDIQGSSFSGSRQSTITGNINGKDIALNAQVFGSAKMSITLDLNAKQVPRFLDDQKFKLSFTLKRNDNSECKDEKIVYILLPVVLVSGIQPFYLSYETGYGWGVFPILTKYFETTSENDLKNLGYLGNKYVLHPFDDSNNGGYQTIYYAKYRVNLARLPEASRDIQKATEIAFQNTYASKCYMVAHSKGVLAARKFIQNYSAGGVHPVKELFAAQGPNTGSYYGALQRIEGWLYPELLPTWPTKAITTAGVLTKPRWVIEPPFNSDLLILNNSDPMFPSSIPLHLLVTPQVTLETKAYVGSTYVVVPNLFPYLPNNVYLSENVYSIGDEVVPLFSQLGRNYNPNMGLRADDPNFDAYALPLVRTLRDANIDVMPLSGSHLTGYIDNISVYLYARIFSSKVKN